MMSLFLGSYLDIYSLKMNQSLLGLEQHKGEFFIFLCELTLYRTQKVLVRV